MLSLLCRSIRSGESKLCAMNDTDVLFSSPNFQISKSPNQEYFSFTFAYISAGILERLCGITGLGLRAPDSDRTQNR